MNKIARFEKKIERKQDLRRKNLQYGPDWDFGLYGN